MICKLESFGARMQRLRGLIPGILTRSFASAAGGPEAVSFSSFALGWVACGLFFGRGTVVCFMKNWMRC